MKTRQIESIQFFLDGAISFCRNDENSDKLIYNDYKPTNNRFASMLFGLIKNNYLESIEAFEDSVIFSINGGF
jgi:hypothetical protein